MFRRRRGKYNAVKTKIDGVTFDSKIEARHYQDLKLRQAAGEIEQLDLHPKYPIEVRGKKICNVVLDFRYRDLKADKYRFIDVKGMDNPLSRLKRKLIEAEYGISVEVVTK